MNRAEQLLAQRYADAFLKTFSCSLKEQDMASFQTASLYFKNKKQACFLLDLSLISEKEKEQAFEGIIKKCLLPEACRSLFKLVVKGKRSMLLSAIFHEIFELYKKQLHVITMIIESSIELSDKEKAIIELFLNEQFQSVVTCSYVVNQKLIAGVRMANENYVWERSARAQLKALQNSGRY